MVRNYRRKTVQKWSTDDLHKALKKVIFNGWSQRKAAITYNIPRSTFNHKLEKPQPLLVNSKWPQTKALTEKEELDLKKYILDHLKNGAKITQRDVRQLAYQIAESSQRKHKLSGHEGMAGIDWYYSFIKRHDLQLGKKKNTNQPVELNSEIVNLYKIPPVNLVTLENYYERLENLMLKQRLDLKPQCIYSAGELILNVDIHMKKVELEDSIIIIACVSAQGSSLPPFIIPKVKLSKNILIGAPPGALFEPSELGLTSEIVRKFFYFFIANAPKQRPLVLILSGLESLMGSDVWDTAEKENIEIVCQPSNCDILQPLKLTIFPFLKDSLHTENTIKPQICDNFCQMFCNAWLNTTTPINIINGFGLCKIFPFEKFNSFSPSESDLDSQPILIDCKPVVKENIC